MIKHQKYDLWLHDDSELSILLDSKVTSRKTIHEWPNSCVQKISLSNGKSYVYKYQSGGIIESSFYENAVSPILPKATTLWNDSWYSCMTIEFIDAPILGQPKLTDTELLGLCNSIVNEIQNIEGDYPVLLDISSYSKWSEIAKETLFLLRKFIDEKRHLGCGMKDIDNIEKVVLSSRIQSVYERRIGLIHGDLNGGNIFLNNGKYKIIDWQSCKLAPIEIDKASFLSRQGVDPSNYVSNEATMMLYFIGIWWLIKCQTEIMPNENFDERITYFINRIRRQNENNRLLKNSK